MTCCCPDCYSNLYHEECCCECCKTDSSICCYCEKNCVKKGLFTIAWSAETPRTSNKPCGIELELCDTPSNIEQKCEELRQWLCRPPIDDLCECKLKVNEFSCPSTVEALSYSCSCHTSSDFKTDELASEIECRCVDESEGTVETTRDQQTNKPSCANIPSSDNATNTDIMVAEANKNSAGTSKSTDKVAGAGSGTEKQAINDIKKILNSITNKAFDSAKQNIGIEVQVDGKTEGRPLICSEIDEALLTKIVDATNDLLNAQLLFKSPEGEVDRILKEKSACIKICLNENLQTEGQPGNTPKAPANTPVDMKFSEVQKKTIKELNDKLAQQDLTNKTGSPVDKKFSEAQKNSVKEINDKLGQQDKTNKTDSPVDKKFSEAPKNYVKELNNKLAQQDKTNETDSPVDKKFSEAQKKSGKELNDKLAQQDKTNKTGYPQTGKIVPNRHSLIRKIGSNKYDFNDEFTILVTCPCTKKPDSSKIVLSIARQDDQVAYKVTDFQVLRTSLVNMNAFKDKNINVNVSGDSGDTDYKNEEFIASHLFEDEAKTTSDAGNVNEERALRRHHSKMSPKELREKLQQAQHKRQEDIEKVKHELEEVEKAKS